MKNLHPIDPFSHMIAILLIATLLLPKSVGSSEASCSKIAITEILPTEILTYLLANLSFYELSNLTRVSRTLYTFSAVMLSEKYGRDFYEIGLEYFAPGADPVEKRSILKFMKLTFDSDLVDTIFNDSNEEIDGKFSNHLDLIHNLPVLKVALKCRTFKSPIFIEDHRVLASLLSELNESGVSISLDSGVFKLFLKNSPQFDWQPFRELIQRSSVHLSFSYKIEKLLESDDGVTLVDARNCSTVTLLMMLCFGRVEDWPKFKAIFENYDLIYFVNSCLSSVLQFNPDRLFGHIIIDNIRGRLNPQTLCSLSHQFIRLDLDPEYYLRLYGFQLGEFEDEAIAGSIVNYGQSPSQSINFVNSAIVLGKSDKQIIRLIENLEKFTCDVGFVSVPFIKGISRPVARALLSRPSSSYDWNRPKTVWFSEVINQTIERLGAGLTFEWILKAAQFRNERLHSFLHSNLQYMTSAQQVCRLLDKIFALGQNSDSFITGLIWIQSGVNRTDDSDRNVFFQLYSLFKSHVPALFQSQSFQARARRLSNLFSPKLLDDYISSVSMAAPDCHSVELAKALRAAQTTGTY